MEHGHKNSEEDSERKRAEENNKLLKRMLVRKGVTALAGLTGGLSLGIDALFDLGDIADIQDVIDMADLEDSDK